MSAYTDPGTFVDLSATVPISAGNLNALKNFVLEMSADKYTDNGGQPPAPKPQGGSTVQGYWTDHGVNAYTTPNVSGTYAGIAFKTGAFYGSFAGAAHNTDLNTLLSTTGINGMLCWRIT